MGGAKACRMADTDPPSDGEAADDETTGSPAPGDGADTPPGATSESDADTPDDGATAEAGARTGGDPDPGDEEDDATDGDAGGDGTTAATEPGDAVDPGTDDEPGDDAAESDGTTTEADDAADARATAGVAGPALQGVGAVGLFVGVVLLIVLESGGIALGVGLVGVASFVAGVVLDRRRGPAGRG